MENVVRELRHDFTAAISSDQNDVTLDPSMAKLSEKFLIQTFSGRSRFTQEVSSAKWVIS